MKTSIIARVVIHGEGSGAIFTSQGDYPVGQYQYALDSEDRWYSLEDGSLADKMTHKLLSKGLGEYRLRRAGAEVA